MTKPKPKIKQITIKLPQHEYDALLAESARYTLGSGRRRTVSDLIRGAIQEVFRLGDTPVNVEITSNDTRSWEVLE